MTIQIYDQDGNQACLFSTKRTDADSVKDDITDAFASLVDPNIEDAEFLLSEKGIERTFVEELTIAASI